MKPLCSRGCGRPTVAKGLCPSHYQSDRLARIRSGERERREPCLRCGASMVGRTSRAKFCTPHCKERWFVERASAAAAEARAGKTCAICKGPITSSTAKAQTCSKVCGIALSNQKRQAARRDPWLASDPTCRRCLAPIPTTRRTGVLYCSARCKHNAMSDRQRERSPGYMRQYLYGITPEQYAERLAAQDNRCAICNTDTPNGKGWHVDHDHATGAIRGVLCTSCNNGLGRFEDDPARLRAAAAYLERPST